MSFIGILSGMVALICLRCCFYTCCGRNAEYARIPDE